MPRSPEPGKPKEQQPLPYHLAATFKTREEAKQPYQSCQQIIYQHELDLSGYRFERQRRDPHQPPLARPWYVVVLGERPPEPIEQQLQET